MTSRRHIAPALACLTALATTGCAHAPVYRYFQPSADQIGPEPNSYGEAVIPRHALIVVQGDGFAYGLARGRSRHAINGADQGQAAITISQALRKVIRGVTVENRGYPGDTVAQSAVRWASAPPASLLILCYGFGDRSAHTSVADFDAALHAMISAAKARGAAVFVVTPPALSDPLVNSELALYGANAAAVASNEGVETFSTGAAMARIKAPPLKTAAQSAAVYQAVAADMIAYIRVVGPPAPGASSPQTGQAGSGDSRTVRVSAANAS